MSTDMTTYLIGGLVAVALAHVAKKAWSKSLLITPDVAFLVPFAILLVVPVILTDATPLSFIAIIGLVAFLLSRIVGLTRNRPLRLKRYLPPIPARRILYALALIHISIILASSVAIVAEHGITGVFQRDRLQQYFESGILASNALNPLRIATELAFFVALGMIKVHGRRRLFYAVLTLFIISISISANTRLSVVLPLLAILAMVIRENRFRIKSIVAINILLIFILPLYLYYTNLLRHGIELSGTETKILSNVLASEFNYNQYLALVDSHVAAKGLEYGYGWFAGSLGNMIPRFAWKDKPVTSTSNRFTETITGEPPSIYNPVITFTIMGEGYFQLGILGAILEVSVFLLLFSKLFWTLLRWENQIGSLAAFHIAMMMLIYFRAELPFVQLLFAFLTLWLVRASLPLPGTTPIRTSAGAKQSSRTIQFGGSH